MNPHQSFFISTFLPFIWFRFEVAFLFHNSHLFFSVLNEVRLLESVSHPNIIRLEEVMDSPEFLVLVLELAEGGELWDQMIKYKLL